MDECTALDGAAEGDWYDLHDFEDFLRRNHLFDLWKTQMMGAEISGVMAFKNKAGEYIYGNMYEGESLNALLFNTTHFHMTFSLGFQRGGGGVPQRGTPQYENFRYAASLFGYDFMLHDAVWRENKLICSKPLDPHASCPIAKQVHKKELTFIFLMFPIQKQYNKKSGTP